MFFGGKKRYQVELLGSEKLRRVARPVGVVDDGIRELAGTMIRTMEVFNGIGLAAPQIGVDLRMIALGVPEDSRSGSNSPGEDALLGRMPCVFINPEIVGCSGAEVPYNEGCLSVPEIFAEVIRPERVIWRAADLDGNVFEYECAGLLARCIMHEMDHLEGKIFVDRLSGEEMWRIAAKLERIDKYGARHHYVRYRKSL